MKKFTGFYEDEESIKMMDLINESATKEYERRKVAYKKAKKQDKLITIFVIGSLIFMGLCVLYISNKIFEKDVAECVAKGNDKAVCEYKLSK